jgi:hypothetical protein
VEKREREKRGKRRAACGNGGEEGKKEERKGK